MLCATQVAAALESTEFATSNAYYYDKCLANGAAFYLYDNCDSNCCEAECGIPPSGYEDPTFCNATATGGASGTGGTTGTGGVPSTGGTTGTGGVHSTGGTTGTGGMIGTGGVTAASGGTSGTGGVIATGGVIGTGGTPCDRRRAGFGRHARHRRCTGHRRLARFDRRFVGRQRGWASKWDVQHEHLGLDVQRGGHGQLEHE